MYLSMAGVGRIVVAVESPQSYNFSGNLSCCRCCRHRRQSGHRTRLTLQNRYRLAVARRCLYPHPVADAPFPPITGKRSSHLCTAVRRRIFPAHGASPTSPAPAISTKKAWFRSQPPQGGAINARAASVLRTTVSAKNPGHNITHNCITPRIGGCSSNRPCEASWGK